MTRDGTIRHSRVLVIAPGSLVKQVTSVLEPVGYTNTHSISDPAQTIAAYDHYQPDIVLLEVAGAPGFEALEQLERRIPDDDFVPIIALAPGTDSSVRLRALAKGAKDFIAIPIEGTEVLTRVANLLEIRLLKLELGDPSKRLDFLVDDVAKSRTRSLEEIQAELLERFARTAEYRDPAGSGHRERLARLSRLIALDMGFPEDRADLIGRAALLHDVGNIGVPESIWNKPASLTSEEFEQMKAHTKIGADILSQGRSPLLWLAEEIAHTHHERWDGNGYLGLEGDAIPIGSRIVAIADAWDALTNDRPYRKARTHDLALEEIQRGAGIQFDPKVVESFMRVRKSPEFMELYR